MDTLSRGEGELFADPSADHARAFFASKPRALVDKLTTVADAVAPSRRTTAIISPSAASAATAFPPPSSMKSSARASNTSRFAGHTATHDFQILCAGNLTRPRADAGRGGRRLRRRPGGARPVAARPPGDGVRRGRLASSGPITPWPCASRRPRWACRSCRPATMLGTDTFRHSAARVDRLPVHRRTPRRPARPVPRRGRHPRPRGRPLRQLPHPRHHRRRPRPGPRRPQAHHHLRTPHPQRRDPPRPGPHRHPVLLRGRGVRSALRQLSGQHAV